MHSVLPVDRREPVKTALTEKIEAARREAEQERGSEIQKAWSAVWPIVLRDAANVSHPNDDRDLTVAIDTLMFWGAVTDEAETIKDCAQTAKSMLKRATLLEVVKQSGDKRCQALAEYRRFKRFAEKVEKRMFSRSRVYETQALDFVSHEIAFDPKYSGLISDDVDHSVILDDETRAVVEKAAADQLAAVDARADELSLPEEVARYVDEFNVQNPSYGDHSDTGYSDRISIGRDEAELNQLHERKMYLTARIRELTEGDIHRATLDPIYHEDLESEAIKLTGAGCVNVDIINGSPVSSIDTDAYAIVLQAAEATVKQLNSDLAEVKRSIADKRKQQSN